MHLKLVRTHPKGCKHVPLRLYSTNNRRLWCLKRHQAAMKTPIFAWARILAHELRKDTWPIRILWHLLSSLPKSFPLGLSRFKDGTPIQELIDQLRKKYVDPMIDDFLIINVGVASVRAHGHRKRFTRYYALDHRRSYCMAKAGCSRIRVRIVPEFCGKRFNEFASKADGLGRPLLEVRVRD